MYKRIFETEIITQLINDKFFRRKVQNRLNELGYFLGKEVRNNNDLFKFSLKVLINKETDPSAIIKAMVSVLKFHLSIPASSFAEIIINTEFSEIEKIKFSIGYKTDAEHYPSEIMEFHRICPKAKTFISIVKRYFPSCIYYDKVKFIKSPQSPIIVFLLNKNYIFTTNKYFGITKKGEQFLFKKSFLQDIDTWKNWYLFAKKTKIFTKSIYAKLVLPKKVVNHSKQRT